MNYRSSGMCKKIIITTFTLLCFLSNAVSQVWQWSVPVTGIEGNARAFLWVPPDCKQVRGIIMAQHNMEEISILENAAFRQKMAKLGFAEMWVSPSPNVLKFFDFSKGAGEITTAYMDSLAKISGYDELRYAPIVGIGHSAAASWPYYYGAWNPSRTLACISVSGQWPYARGGNFAPDIWKPGQNINYIPCLETMGEYEAAATWSNEGLKEMQDHPLLPLSMLAVPGEGHFATSERKTKFIAFYIEKAAQYPKGKPVELKPVDPTKSGWLADRWRLNNAPAAAATPVGKYRGSVKDAFWYFDEETVRAVENYGAAFRGLKPQLVGYVQEEKMAPQQNTHLQVKMKFLPESDGLTFHLKGAFYDTVPLVSTRLTGWTGLPVGATLDHSNNINAIVIDKICGPFKKLSDTTFIFQLDRGVDLNSKQYTFTLTVRHPGDDKFKSAIQQGEIVIPAFLKEGVEQKINFPSISNQKAGIKDLKLMAISDAGLPVNFYVLDGPAEIKGNVLRFTQIPPKSKFPIKITVIAWQYGIAGKIQTAQPVTNTFYLLK
jgi:hypothetical protein